MLAIQIIQNGKINHSIELWPAAPRVGDIIAIDGGDWKVKTVLWHPAGAAGKNVTVDVYCVR